jgi:Na+/proline symporter
MKLHLPKLLRNSVLACITAVAGIATTTVGTATFTGGVVAFVWNFFVSKLGGIFAVYELAPAFLLSSVAIVAVSLLTKAPSAEIEEDFAYASAK